MCSVLDIDPMIDRQWESLYIRRSFPKIVRDESDNIKTVQTQASPKAAKGIVTIDR